MIMYYDRQGETITLQEWAKLNEKLDYKIVKRSDTPGNKYRVSTVWLGMDYNPFGTEPEIFETMVFRKIGDDLDMGDLDMQRYTTEIEAFTGHATMLEKWTEVEANES